MTWLHVLPFRTEFYHSFDTGIGCFWTENNEMFAAPYEAWDLPSEKAAESSNPALFESIMTASAQWTCRVYLSIPSHRAYPFGKARDSSLNGGQCTEPVTQTLGGDE
jgi:hypothetical protein